MRVLLCLLLPFHPGLQGTALLATVVLFIHSEMNTQCVKCFRAERSDGSFKGHFPLGRCATRNSHKDNMSPYFHYANQIALLGLPWAF